MHVIVNRNALVDVLGVASGIAVTRSPKEVLKCIRLTTVDGSLRITATDLEVGLRAEVKQVEVKAKGDTLVPADKLVQIVRESGDETLAIETSDQVCHIRGRDSHFEIYGQDPKDYPPVAELTAAPDIEVSVEALGRLIERSVFAVAKENTRYAINGVLWVKHGKKLSLIATDGRRLAQAVGSVEVSAGEDAQMIVPAKMVHVVQRVLGGAEGRVAVLFGSNQVVVGCGAYVVSSALVEGHFPDYERVIPQDNDTKLEVDTELFLSAVRRAALLTNEQSKGLRLRFEKEQLVLSSRAPEQGEATVSMPIQYDGKPMEIGFNPTFLVDALRVVGVPTITMELKASGLPGILRIGQEFIYVVMPVSLS